MKNFLSIEKFKELKAFILLEVAIIALLLMLISVNNFEINFWDWKAFSLSISIWLLSSAAQKEIYWNLATLLTSGFIMYLVWWFIFNIQ